MPAKSSPKLDSQALDFNSRWAGYATAKEPFGLEHSRSPEPYFRFTQRNGERPEDILTIISGYH
jgi:hypothetical protein